MENGYIESFHGKFREECLNEHWFLTLDDARETIENWRIGYNRVMQTWKAKTASHIRTTPAAAT
jgi:transposase InsO family protein